MNSLVSIIIPAYNRESLLPTTLKSIQNQSYKHFECLIVDDGSTDNTVEAAFAFEQSDDRFRVFKRPSDIKKGGNACRNYGFSLANGKYINWFDSDDIMLPGMLEKMVLLLEKDQADMAVCGNCSFTEDPAQLQFDGRGTVAPITDNPPFEFFAGGFWFATQQPIFRKEVLSKFAYQFDTRLKRNQETEFFVRVLLTRPRVAYINEPLIAIRRHEMSISGNYHTLPKSAKLLIDYPAYRQMYAHFKKSDYLTKEAEAYFKDFFFRCLRKMDVSIKDFTELYLMGIQNEWFPNSVHATRLYLSRTFRKLFLSDSKG